MAKENESPLGRFLRQTRTEQDVSLRELARKSDLSLSHVSYIETGAKTPGPIVLGRLTSALELKPGVLALYGSLTDIEKACHRLEGLMDMHPDLTINGLGKTALSQKAQNIIIDLLIKNNGE